MKVLNQTVETVPVAALKLHPRNVNQGDVGAIHESIKHNGFWGTIVAQKSTGHVLAGNHRLMAAQQMGAEEVPVAWVDVDDDAALKILLADNRTTRLGQDDPQALAEMLQEILADSGTLDGTAFDTDDLDELLKDLGMLDEPEAGDDPGAQVDRAAELQEQWGTERGQIWAIPSKTVPGKSHRLMCGDSTSAEDVGRLMGGALAGMVFTDPPYGVGFQSGMSEGGTATRFGKLQNDDVMLDVAPAVWSVMADDSAAFVWTSHQVYPQWREQFADFYKHTIVWHKPGGGIGDLEGNYATDYELCLFCVKGRPVFREKRGMAVWTVEKDGVMDYAHPTQKPTELAERAMADFSDRGATVADLFGGSGSTFVAAEKAARVCFGMELDPKYVAVILERLTGMGLEPHRVTRDEAE